MSGAVINQAATHHFLPARIQGAGRERAGGGAGRSSRPLQAPGPGEPASLAALACRPDPRPLGPPRLRAATSRTGGTQVGGGGGVRRGERPGRRGRGRLDSSRGAGRASGWQPEGDCGGSCTHLQPCLSGGGVGVQCSALTRPSLPCLLIPFHSAHFLAGSGVMQAFAIFAVCFLGNNNKQVTGEGGFCNNPALS